MLNHRNTAFLFCGFCLVSHDGIAESLSRHSDNIFARIHVNMRKSPVKIIKIHKADNEKMWGITRFHPWLPCVPPSGQSLQTANYKLQTPMAYTTNFTARVLRCEKTAAGYAVFLDHTLFYAEGGGQPSDRGWIAGAAMADVRNTAEGMAHFVASAIAVGETVACEIDFKRRFSFMQHHTAEHILSGLAERRYGYRNVGFHIGEDCTAVDFDGEWTPEQVSEMEVLVNQAVWDDVPVTEQIIRPGETVDFPYRSKRDIAGDIRVVTVEGCDRCACCGTHVRRTGEIGVVKFIDTKRHRGGIRIFMRCGETALEDYAAKQKIVRGLCAAFSSKEADLMTHAIELLAIKERLVEEVSRMRLRLFKKHIESMEITSPFVWTVWEDAEPKELPAMAAALAELAAGALVLAPRAGGGYYAAVASPSGQAREIAAGLCAACGGRGGGSAVLWQGSLERVPED